jgi:hypothetical protein
MPFCNHEILTLLPPAGARLRCRHCHLTITAGELDAGCCPECLEVHGQRRYDFEEVPSDSEGRTRYRCEACGLILDA